LFIDNRIKYKDIIVVISTNKCEGKVSLGERLREERDRINKKQKEIASYLDINRKTWGKYERNETVPDLSTLGKLHQIGFDIAYVVTGNKITISDEEEKIIKQYRKSNETVKFVIRSIFDAFEL